MIELKYWIIFDGIDHPEIIVAKTWIELSAELTKKVIYHNKPPEHIIRKY